MKKLSLLTLAISAAVFALLPACSHKENPEPVVEEEGIVLRFLSDQSFIETKVPKDGVEQLNENRLASVEYFLYSDNNKDGDAVIHGYKENVQQNRPISIPMTNDLVNNTLCPNNATSFWVFAIANHPRIVANTNPENLSGTSVEALKARVQNIEMEGSGVKPVQTSFLMSTQEAVEVTGVKRRNTTVASATIGLTRVAAKISVLVRVAPSTSIRNEITISGVSDVRTEVWKPRLGQMQVYLVNGAKIGNVGGVPVENQELFEYQPFGFDMTAGESHSYDTYTKRIDPNTGDEVLDAEGQVIYDKTTTTDTFYPSEYPFYTYPESWGYGSAEEPYIKLVIPWDREAGVSDKGTPFGTASRQYYYRVYCPATAIDASSAQFLRNNWYKVILNVSILGSETDGGEMVINGQYYVVDWQERDTGGGSSTGINDTDKDAEIKGARYLFVSEKNYTLYNLEELSIPYVTSDPCEIVDFTAQTYDFSSDTKQTRTVTDMAAWNMDVSLVTTQTGAHIEFSHPLNNDMSTGDYDVAPYTISFKIRHKDNAQYVHTITIKQYPSIVIDPQTNTDNGATTHNGYVYIDGNNSTNNSSTWKNLASLTGGNNANPNMYVISTSVLSDKSMLIGDPRTTTAYTDADLVSGWTSTPGRYIGTNANNHRLTSYYPTNSDEAFKNVIAPTFRVASSYGKSSSMSYTDALRRCASYQEDGYPAGRWRLPTMAEVLYITTLSHDGMIPELFTFSATEALDESYWCASGKIDGVYGVPTYYSGTNGNRWTRCVYDEWYWSGYMSGETDVSRLPTNQLSNFTWGDIPRP